MARRGPSGAHAPSSAPRAPGTAVASVVNNAAPLGAVRHEAVVEGYVGGAPNLAAPTPGYSQPTGIHYGDGNGHVIWPSQVRELDGSSINSDFPATAPLFPSTSLFPSVPGVRRAPTESSSRVGLNGFPVEAPHRDLPPAPPARRRPQAPPRRRAMAAAPALQTPPAATGSALPPLAHRGAARPRAQRSSSADVTVGSRGRGVTRRRSELPMAFAASASEATNTDMSIGFSQTQGDGESDMPPCSPSSNRSRSASPKRSRVEAAATTGAPKKTPTLSDMLMKSVKDGFSSLRKELTLVKAQLVFVKSQQVTTMEKMKALNADTDAAVAAKGEKAGRLDALVAKADRIFTSLDKSDGDGSAASAADDNEWVMTVKVRLVEKIFALFGSATVAADVYLSTEDLNVLLVDLTAEVLAETREGATERLQQKRLFPVRKPAKGFGRLVVYQYIKRAPAHTNCKITTLAVFTFLKRLHHYCNVGHWEAAGSSQARKELVLSGAESSHLLTGNAFIVSGLPRMATLDALAQVFEYMQVSSTMVVWTGPSKTTRLIRCLLAHVANVTFRIRSYLRARAGVCSVGQVQSPLNEGLRAPWLEELLSLKVLLPPHSEVVNGLQLTDGASPARASGGRDTPAASAAPMEEAPPQPVAPGQPLAVQSNVPVLYMVPVGLPPAAPAAAAAADDVLEEEDVEEGTFGIAPVRSE